MHHLFVWPSYRVLLGFLVFCFLPSWVSSQSNWCLFINFAVKFGMYFFHFQRLLAFSNFPKVSSWFWQDRHSDHPFQLSIATFFVLIIWWHSIVQLTKPEIVRDYFVEPLFWNSWLIFSVWLFLLFILIVLKL